MSKRESAVQIGKTPPGTSRRQKKVCIRMKQRGIALRSSPATLMQPCVKSLERFQKRQRFCLRAVGFS